MALSLPLYSIKGKVEILKMRRIPLKGYPFFQYYLGEVNPCAGYGAKFVTIIDALNYSVLIFLYSNIFPNFSPAFFRFPSSSGIVEKCGAREIF